jgi:hypothetical protein
VLSFIVNLLFFVPALHFNSPQLTPPASHHATIMRIDLMQYKK